MGRTLFSFISMVAVIFMATTTLANDGPNRRALVIGNSSYMHAEFLRNAATDARDVANKLRDIGFDVHEGHNLIRADMLRLAVEFTQDLQSDDIALFYFSGHGVQIGAENYILPIDARGSDEIELKRASISLQAILKEMELRAPQNIIILDACRNNPLQPQANGRSIGGGTRGLARLDAGIGSYIAFATQPGNIANDGAGRNSPFTEALLNHLDDRTADLHEMMRRVRADVIRKTERTQIPWENSSLIDQVFLAGQPPAPQLSQNTVPPAPVTVPTIAQTPPRPAPDPNFTHIVSGLDPNGDGFLALRNGYTSGASRIAKMAEGTRLQFIGQSGQWMNVRTETGLIGWAHVNWIRGYSGMNRAATYGATSGLTCEQLWVARNTLFAKRGYCFQSARGKAAFGHLPCVAGQSTDATPLTNAERDQVSQLLAAERAQGCR